MKHHYGQYRFSLLRQSSGKRPLSEFNLDIFKEFVEAEIAPFYESKGELATKDDAENVILFAETEFRVYQGEGVHVFVDPETEGVIRKAIRNIEDADLIKYRPDAQVGVVYSAGRDPILFVSKGDGGSLGISSEKLGILRIDGMIENGWMCATDESHAALCEQMRLVCGVFMMRESFPEMFLKGPPADLLHPAWYRKLNTAHISLGHVRSDMAPHIRRGHFRLLSSEKFTKKRGQLVFVKASMVNADAVHTEKGVTK